MFITTTQSQIKNIIRASKAVYVKTKEDFNRVIQDVEPAGWHIIAQSFSKQGYKNGFIIQGMTTGQLYASVGCVSWFI